MRLKILAKINRFFGALPSSAGALAVALAVALAEAHAGAEAAGGGAESAAESAGGGSGASAAAGKAGSAEKSEFSDKAEMLAAAMDWDAEAPLSPAEYAAAKKAADAGNAEAQFVVGAANLLGAGCEKNLQTAAMYMSMSAFSKYPLGMFGLAVCMRDAKGMPESPKSSYAYFKRAAQAGCARAANALGVCYYNGYGAEKNYSKAMELFKRAADAGVARAYVSLGRAALEGLGLQKSAAARNFTVSEASKLIALYEQNETLWLKDSNAAEDKYELADGIMVDMRQEKTNQFGNAVINAYLVHYQGDMYILIVESTIEDITNQVCIYLTRKDDEIIVERWER